DNPSQRAVQTGCSEKISLLIPTTVESIMSSSESHIARPSPAPSSASAKSAETTKSVPTATIDKTPDDSGKLRAFLGILKK
ncbi:MAG: hypothetical protein LQ340_007890, partial [Diploschistes diacapsis]